MKLPLIGLAATAVVIGIGYPSVSEAGIDWSQFREDPYTITYPEQPEFTGSEGIDWSDFPSNQPYTINYVEDRLSTPGFSGISALPCVPFTRSVLVVSPHRPCPPGHYVPPVTEPPVASQVPSPMTAALLGLGLLVAGWRHVKSTEV